MLMYTLFPELIISRQLIKMKLMGNQGHFRMKKGKLRKYACEFLHLPMEEKP